MVKRIYITITIVFFFGLIWLPVIQTLVPFVKEPPNSERRVLAAFPTIPNLTLDSIKEFRFHLGDYINDNLGFRRLLIQWSSLVKIRLLDMFSIENVIIGKDGWLFYNNPDDGIGINDYLGKTNYSLEQLEAIKGNLDQIRNSLSKRGIRFLLCIAPNKQTIYSEYLPEKIRNYAGKTCLDQLVQYIRENGDITLVDFRSVLLSGKQNYPVYLRTDTHWTIFGAFLAYKRIMTEIVKTHQGAKVLDMNEMSVTTQKTTGDGDLAGMLSLVGFFDEQYVNVEPNTSFMSKKLAQEFNYTRGRQIHFSEGPVRNAPRLLVFGDSFMADLFPFLAESFSKSVWLQSRSIDYKLIDREQPDIVVLEICERYHDELLMKVLSTN